MSAPSPLEGIDYEWFAVDDDGHLAAFTTAGIAPVPAWVLGDLPRFDALALAIAQLPARGEARITPDACYDERGLRDYRAWAERGLFAYDWVDVHRARDRSDRYELIAAPAVALVAAALRSPLAGIPRLDGVRFAVATRIKV